MLDSTTYSDFRKNLKAYLDQATDDFEPVAITRSNHPNAVLVSQEEYDNMKENEFVLGNAANRKWLENSKRQLEEGKVKKHNIDLD